MAVRASLVESGIVTAEQLLPIKGLRPRLPGGQGRYSRAIPSSLPPVASLPRRR